MRLKKRELHELPYTEIVKSTINRLTSHHCCITMCLGNSLKYRLARWLVLSRIHAALGKKDHFLSVCYLFTLD